MQIGMVGLGTMGGHMVQRLAERGHEVIGFDPNAAAREAVSASGVQVASTLSELIEALAPPRKVWVMVPPGEPTTSVVEELSEYLETGDTVIDGGNSDFRDAQPRSTSLAGKGIHFMDVGVSGGQWGFKIGYGLTAGGSEEVYKQLLPALEALAAPSGYAHVGATGAGHLVKAVHNGVQYGVMQAYAEGFAILSARGDVEVLASMDVWQNGCSIRSFLLEQMIAALAANPTLADVSTNVSDSGMGRWTAQEATRLGVPTPVLSMALQARFASRDNGDANKLLSASRTQVGGQKS